MLLGGRTCLAARHAAGLPVIRGSGRAWRRCWHSHRCPPSQPLCWPRAGRSHCRRSCWACDSRSICRARCCSGLRRCCGSRAAPTPRPGCAAALTRGRFVVWWLLTLSGSIGVFMAADLVSFYLVFSMVSLAAYGLIVDDGTPRARRSGLIYVALALLGEAFLLMAFVLLAEGATGDGLLISDVMAALSASPWRAAILTLLILGFGAKIGLVPFHVWMPLAYRAAPIPAAAVLSGAAVKAGVIGLIRFLPLDASMPGWGGALAAAGLLSAFYGVAIGITQSNPKAVLAYSSVSQMGVLATVFGMGLVSGNSGDCTGRGVLRSAPHPREGCLVSRRRGRRDRRRASTLAGPAAGSGTGARPRRASADRRRARQAGSEDARRRRLRCPAHEPVLGRDHAADGCTSCIAWRCRQRGMRRRTTRRRRPCHGSPWHSPPSPSRGRSISP